MKPGRSSTFCPRSLTGTSLRSRVAGRSCGRPQPLLSRIVRRLRRTVETLADNRSSSVRASEVDLAMSGERGKEVGKEWLQALGTDVAGGLPEQREREAKVLTVAAPSRLSKNRLWTSTPATQQRHRVLAVVASGQAKGIQQFPPQPLARRRVAFSHLCRQLVPLGNPHRSSRLRARLGLGQVSS